MPTLSVIIPNYNHAKYLPESLEAILSQSLQPKEIVIVDDASTDESCALISEYQKTHSHLHLVRLEKNSGGPIIPLQEGLKRVTGDYLALCASDDKVLPGFFEEAMEFLTKHPFLAICCGDLAIFKDRKPYQLRRQRYLSVEEPVIFTPDELAKTCYKTRFQISSQASLYRRETLVQFKGYDAALEGYSDFYLNYQIGFNYPIGYVPRQWATYRELSRSYGIGLNWGKRFRLCQTFISKIIKEPREVKKRWSLSGVLVNAHWMMGLCLLLRPSVWYFLLAYLPKWMDEKARYYLKLVFFKMKRKLITQIE